MSFIATTLEIPQSATELTISELQQISGGWDPDPKTVHHHHHHHIKKIFKVHNHQVANESVVITVNQDIKQRQF